MSALLRFVQEIRRQADLLERASLYDDAALTPSPPDDQRWMGRGPRRRWTRQDGNRCEWECDVEDALASGDADRLYESLPRMRTRVAWFAARFSRPPHAVDSLRGPALADARDQGIYSVVATLVTTAVEAHRRLLTAYGGGDFPEDGADWGDVESEWRNAVEGLESHLPADSPAGTKEQSHEHAPKPKTAGGEPEPRTTPTKRRQRQDIVKAYLYDGGGRQGVADYLADGDAKEVSRRASEHRKHGWWTPEGIEYDPEKFRNGTNGTR